MESHVHDSHPEEAVKLDAPVDHESVEEEEVRDVESQIEAKHGHETLIEGNGVELHDLLQDIQLGKERKSWIVFSANDLQEFAESWITEHSELLHQFCLTNMIFEFCILPLFLHLRLLEKLLLLNGVLKRFFLLICFQNL